MCNSMVGGDMICILRIYICACITPFKISVNLMINLVLNCFGNYSCDGYMSSLHR